MEKSIPKGLIYPTTVKTIMDNGGEVGSEEVLLRNIEQEKPYLDTVATQVTFISGEHIYYNERGIWNDYG